MANPPFFIFIDANNMPARNGKGEITINYGHFKTILFKIDRLSVKKMKYILKKNRTKA
jgi:hypothetical protein